MEIRKRRGRPHIPEIRVEKKEEEEEQPLSPAARLFHAPEFNCNIISVVGLKSKIKPAVIIDGIKQTLIRHPRFSCKLVSPILSYLWYDTLCLLSVYIKCFLNVFCGLKCNYYLTKQTYNWGVDKTIYRSKTGQLFFFDV